MSETNRKAAFGLVYVLVLALLVALSLGTYLKAMPWHRTAEVTLLAARAGLALNLQADVKFQGVLVGTVRQVQTDTDGVRIKLALQPGKLDLIPADVDPHVVPKTLFGEKFVDLVGSAHPAPERLHEGQVLRVSATSVEVSDLFTQLEPVLRAVEPAKLSIVLSVISEVLDGRGEQIAATLNRTRAFLEQVNPQLPVLVEDLQDLGRTAELYADGAGRLGTILDSAAELSTGLIVPRRQQFDQLLDEVTGVAEQSSALLDRSGGRYVRLTGRLLPLTKLLNEYSSSIGCTISGMKTVDTLVNEAIGSRGPFVSLTVDLLASQEPYRYPEDLPTNPGSTANDKNLPKIFPRWDPHCPTFAPEVKALTNHGPYSQLLPGVTLQPEYQPDDTPQAGTQASEGRTAAPTDADVAKAREALARATAASLTGRDYDEVPGYTGLLLAPLLSDGKVDLR
ncbi:MCE family protein [Nocardioides sp. NPDC127514]|uniref:MCE family protein n=1 Tax=unclassified Nocardioides TaxID=2615069 RepID=UPI003325F4B5